jgi:hypothetical protein
MVLTHHLINFKISSTDFFLHNIGTFFNWNSTMNSTPSALSGTTLTSASTMFQKVINLLMWLICSFVSMFTLPYQLIQRFYAHRAFTGFVVFNVNELRSPLFICKPLNGLLLHWLGNFNQLLCIPMLLICFTLGILSKIITRCSSSFSNIAVQFSTNCRGLITNFQGYYFLFHSRLEESLNLIPLDQTEVIVFFRHKQSNDCTTQSNDKMPLKAFRHFFLKIAIIT